MINRPNTNSNFRSPYLSSIKKDNVSMTVISTPTQSGILNYYIVFSNYNTVFIINYRQVNINIIDLIDHLNFVFYIIFIELQMYIIYSYYYVYKINRNNSQLFSKVFCKQNYY